MNRRTISFAGGSHGNFLCLVVNTLINKDRSYKVLGKAFDEISYSKKIPNECIAIHEGCEDIGIIIDNEILWLHQYLCRVSDKNYHILDFEKNFISFALKHPGLKYVIDDFIQINRKKYPNYDKNKLKWFYKNKIFGKIKSAEPSQNHYSYKHEFPFSAFYNFEKLVYYVKQIIPNSDVDVLKTLYDELHTNLIHTDKNIDKIGSILVESWQEYTVDTFDNGIKIKTSNKDKGGRV